jgi:hypothetical protein
MAVSAIAEGVSRLLCKRSGFVFGDGGPRRLAIDLACTQIDKVKCCEGTPFFFTEPPSAKRACMASGMMRNDHYWVPHPLLSGLLSFVQA